MARVRVEGLWDALQVEACPWAEYLLPVGLTFVPSQTGDLVWVDFPYGGDSRLPRITGSAQYAPAGKPNLPPEAWNGEGAYEPPRTEGQPPADPITPTKDYTYHRNGLLERRTAGGGVSFTHVASGTEIGFNDAGQILLRGAKEIHIEGTNDVTIKTAKSMTLEALDKVSMKAGQGFSIEAGGAMTIEAGGAFSLTAAGVDVTC